MELQLLGPMRVLDDHGSLVPVTSLQQRRLLALLGLSCGVALSVDRIVDGVWGAEPPPAAARAVQVYVSELRKRLGARAISTEPPGYLLAPEVGTDIDRFMATVAAGRRELQAGNAASARMLLDEALALYRGPALADFRYDEFAAAEADRLEEERLSALEARHQSALECGESGGLVPALQRLVAEYPLRERFVEQLMVALYRSGRQGDALAVYQDARSRLAEELGLDPGPRLRELERELLNQAHEVPTTTDSGRPPAGELPLTLDLTVGRDAELSVLLAHLSGGARLVMVVGPGGVGKTRLLLEASRSVNQSSPRPVVFVPLETAQDTPAAVSMIAQRVAAEQKESSLDNLVIAVGSNPLMLVLDNLEQIDGFAGAAAELLARCAHLTIVGSSRVPLGIHGERLLQLDPLLFPDSASDLGEALEFPALRLLADRAQAAVPDLKLADSDVPALIEICRRTDGLPLGLELAAARLRVMRPEELARRLPATVLSMSSARRTSERQHTLRETVEWSYALLTADEREMLDRFSVFVGGATLHAIEGAFGTDAVDIFAALADASLVRYDRTTGRFTMLEVVRAFGADRLAQDPAREREARRAHASYFADLCRQRGTSWSVGWRTDLASDAVVRDLGREVTNVQGAFDWSFDAHSDLAADIGPELAALYVDRGQPGEEQAVFLRASVLKDLSVAGRVLLTMTHSSFLVESGRSTEALDMLGDAHKLALDTGQDRLIYATAMELGWWTAVMGDLSDAEGFAAVALAAAERADRPLQFGVIRNLLGCIAIFRDRLEEARQHVASYLAVAEDAGGRPQQALALANLAEIEILVGETVRAESSLDRARGLIAPDASVYIFITLEDVSGGLALRRGDAVAAAREFGLVLDRRLRHGIFSELATSVGGVAYAAHLAGDTRTAAELFAACERLVAIDPVYEATAGLHRALKRELAAAVAQPRDDKAGPEGATKALQDAREVAVMALAHARRLETT